MGFLGDEHIEATCPSASPSLYVVMVQPMDGASIAIVIHRGLVEHAGDGGAGGGPLAMLAGVNDDVDFNLEGWLPNAKGGRRRR